MDNKSFAAPVAQIMPDTSAQDARPISATPLTLAKPLPLLLLQLHLQLLL